MMCKFKIIFVFLILFILTLSFAEETKRVLVIYDSFSRIGEDYPIEKELEEYLSHYGVYVGSVNSEDVLPDVTQYDLVIYLGFQEKILKKEFLKEISKSKKIVWIEENIDQFAKYIGCNEFRDVGKRYGFIEVNYKGYKLSFDPQTFIHLVLPKKANVLSYVSDDLNKFPYVFQKDNLYYFGRLDFRDSSGIVFLDLLHDILGVNHPSFKKALLVFDGIDPFTSADLLQEKLPAVCCQQIPYSIVVYPTVKKDGKLYYLSDNEKLLKVLLEIENSNIGIIQGSYYEKNYDSKINSDLNLLASYGIYPIAFKFYDVPYKERYIDPSKFFNIILDNDIIATKRLYTLIYPINAGIYNPKDPKNVNLILRKAKDFLVLRDAILGISIPIYLDKEDIERLILGLKDLGYDFLDLLKEPYRVENDKLIIMNKNGNKVVVSNVLPYSKSRLERFFEKFVGYLRIILIFVVTSFIIIILYLVNFKIRLYERGKKQ